MSLSVKVNPIGFDKLREELGKLPKSVTNAANKAVNKAAADMRTEVRRSIRVSSGKYRQYGNHWSSPPNTAPNNDTGNLMRSVAITQRATLKTRMLAVLSVAAEYGLHLEYGTAIMEPRPFMRPAFNKISPQLRTDIENAIEAAMQALGRSS